MADGGRIGGPTHTVLSIGKPFIKGSAADGFQVGFIYPDGQWGPCAQVTFEKDWLHIVTDSYEGHAMLKIESLPALRKALLQISRAIATSAPAHPPLDASPN